MIWQQMGRRSCLEKWGFHHGSVQAFACKQWLLGRKLCYAYKLWSLHCTRKHLGQPPFWITNLHTLFLHGDYTHPPFLSPKSYFVRVKTWLCGHGFSSILLCWDSFSRWVQTYLPFLWFSRPWASWPLMITWPVTSSLKICLVLEAIMVKKFLTMISNGYTPFWGFWQPSTLNLQRKTQEGIKHFGHLIKRVIENVMLEDWSSCFGKLKYNYFLIKTQFNNFLNLISHQTLVR